MPPIVSKSDRVAIEMMQRHEIHNPNASTPSPKWPADSVPVPIRMPTAPPQHRTPARPGANPFSVRRFGNNLRGGSGNQTARATPLHHTAKRRRMDDTPRYEVSKPLLSPEIIRVDDDGEDTGQLIASDDLNLRDPPVASSSRSPQPWMRPSHGELPSDPIDEADMHVPEKIPKIDFRVKEVVPNQTKKNVQAKIVMYEGMNRQPSNSPVPKPKVVSSMKSRTGVSQAQSHPKRIPPTKSHQVDPLTTSTPWKTSKGQASSSKASPKLVITKAVLGKQLLENYDLTWDSKVLHIKGRADGDAFSTILALSVSELTRVVYTDSAGPERIIQLTCGTPTLRSRTVVPRAWRNEFIPGIRGTITLTLSEEQPVAWYEELLALVRQSTIPPEVVRGSQGAHSLWERAMRERLQSGPQMPSRTASPPPESKLNRKRKASDLSQYAFDKEKISPTTRKQNGQVVSVRRSSRQSESKGKQPAPVLNPDEVILVFPFTGVGGVPITNGDLARLSPGEFLNDNLIEYGLKFWWNELEQTNPELAKDIHIFSSFFYKKLSKKNLQDAYANIKRWTSKVDIFSKKIIIVPINENFHWYLAIIYMPEYVLQPPPPQQTPNTRRKAKVIEIPSSQDDPPPLASPLAVGGPGVERQDIEMEFDASAGPARDDESISGDASCRSEEGQVEDELLPSAPSTPAPARPPSDGPPSSPLTPVSSPMRVDNPTPARLPSPKPSPSPTMMESMATVNICDDDSRTISSDSDDPLCGEEVKDATDQAGDATVKHPYLSKGKQKWRSKNGRASSSFDELNFFPPMEVDTEEVVESPPNGRGSVASPLPGPAPRTTYIFTMDSLGSRHTKVGTTLSQYLQLEAKERKGLVEFSKPVSRMAAVPPQPNFCDCGIYLLHYAKVFSSDHARFSELILTQTKRSEERNTAWQTEDLHGFRESFAEQIKKLSTEWREVKKKKDELDGDVVQEVDSSDSEILVVEGSPKKPKKSKPARLRG